MSANKRKRAVGTSGQRLPPAGGTDLMYAGLASAVLHCPKDKGVQITFCDGRHDTPIGFGVFDLAEVVGAEAIEDLAAKDLVALALTLCTGVDHEAHAVIRTVGRRSYLKIAAGAR